MDVTKQPTHRDNGPASDNNITSHRSMTTAQRHDHGGAAAEQQPLVKDTKKNNKDKGTKSLWVTVFRCFFCGKHGHNLPKCRQCGAQAYYCNADCQRKHWKKHKPVCRAAVGGGGFLLLANFVSGHAQTLRLRWCYAGRYSRK